METPPVWGPPVPPREVQLTRGEGKGRREISPQVTATPHSRSDRGQNIPQCHQCHSSALPSTTMGVPNSPGVPGPPCAPQLCRDLKKAAMASTGGPPCAQGATG